MLKNKLPTLTIISFLLLIGLAAPVKAGSVLSIQSLPSYINYRDFKLSCTSNSTSVTFSVNRHGGGAVAFATVNPASGCLAQVTSAQIPEETDYIFTVNDNDNPALTSGTSTVFDNSGPSAVSGYSRDGLSDGFRLHYHTPSDSDFDKVKIYRGDSAGFSADSSHEIATVNSSPNSDMTYEDHFGMVAGKTYYYYIRALDHAGNSSPLTGDGGGTFTQTASSPVPGSQNVVILPAMDGRTNGSVLGTEATSSPTSEPTSQPTIVERITNLGNQSPGLIKWILTHKKISIGVGLVLLATAYGIYALAKKRK